MRRGRNVLAIQGLNRTKTGNDFLIYPSVQGISLLDFSLEEDRYFAEPSPGLPNGEGLKGATQIPRASHPCGCYSEAFSLRLACDTPDAVIHYTLDRKAPDEDSPVYQEPLPIEKTTVVRARAYAPGLLPSDSVTYVYVKVHSSVADFSSNLPLMVALSFGQSFTDQRYTPIYLLAMDTTAGRASLMDFAPFASAAVMKWRGSSSLQFPKKMFSLELQGETGRERETALLGLPPESDWVLYAPYSDKSLMRNVLSYAWSNRIGRYAPRTRFFELYVNRTGDLRSLDYQGVYVLTEKIKRGRYRVNITPIYPSQNEEPEVTGGYIIKKDRRDPGDAGFQTPHNPDLCYVYPKERQNPLRPPQQVITPEQKAYLLRFLTRFEAALYGRDFRDPEKGYANYIDVGSFIDHHIMVELTKNIDGYRLSTFMFKDRGGKLNMGPIWDYNLSLGNADYLQGWRPDGWYYPQVSAAQYPWYPRLFQDPAFREAYEERWFELRQGPFRLDRLLADVTENVELLREAQERNFKKWRILGKRVWPNWFIAKTWEEEVEWMKQWIRDRVRWIDSQFIDPPKFNRKGGDIEAGFELTMTAKVPDIYYTLNGPDPASESGDPVPEARLYSGPIVLNDNTRVRARCRVGGSWSPLTEAVFTTHRLHLVVTEIMYHPPSPPEGSPFTARDFEFLEVYNAEPEAIDLGEAAFARGISFSFAGNGVTRLEPGAYAVIVKNREAFESRYNTSDIFIAGEYDRATDSLSDRSETIELKGPLGERILRFAYRDEWYPETDGHGYSLVIRDPTAPLESWGEADAWRRSTLTGGSPGKEDPSEPPPGGWQKPGDANQDGRLTVSDAVVLLRILLGSNTADLPCEGASLSGGGNAILLDLNGDGKVNLADTTYLLGYLFLEGPPSVFGTRCTRIVGCPDVCTP